MKLLQQFFRHQRRKYSSTTKWQSVVGLEVHAQISSASKLFSGSSTEFASPVNTNVSLFDSAVPGTLPVLNKKCVEAGVMTALALNCRVNPVSYFDRKHYFYADLPAGYQITQQRAPLANDGVLRFHVHTPGTNKKPYVAEARIKQIQLEQDSGKSLHDDYQSLVDLNRAGAPLMELVFEPDLKNAEEAASLVKELIIILERIQTCSCKMEEGALRVDANVSIHKPGSPLGTRTEIKNIGSVRGVAGAIKYEIERQIKVLESGGEIVNETRAWDATTKTTLAMRDKEQKQDYRYMPEPNLPPLHIALGPVQQGCVNVNEIVSKIPELPEDTRNRLRESFGLVPEHAIILVNESKLQKLFEDVLALETVNPKLLANILINEYLALIHAEKLALEDVETPAKYMRDIIKLLTDGIISRNTARLVLEKIIKGCKDSPIKIVEDEDWRQITDENKLRQICQEVIDENPKATKQYLGGKTKVFKFFLGAVTTKTNQRANMTFVNNILKELLDKSKK
ncbi:glutamyl-trna gln amidotransferase [Holotrichia oblita]|uniref:Glutamyl-trna gln amidotransferase n=1 Tax=Holotrichia oblita TaxID=644536 RepID=A0ACB9TJV3_HOLOL|nr:glutamyl-trna gln amidotransferase [Holotrichia oblita]